MHNTNIIQPIIDAVENEDIGMIIRTNRFPNFEKILYPQNSIEVINNFIKCYKIFITAINFLQKNNKEQLYQKLIEYLNALRNIDIELSKYLIVYENISDFNRYKIIKKINNFYIKYRNEIDEFINFVYKFGKITKEFDIEQYQGTTF